MFLGIQPTRLSGSGSTYGVERCVAVAPVAVKVMIKCLKKKRTVPVPAKRDDIRFHYRFVARVIGFERTTVKADKADLCSQPEIAFLIEQEVVDAVLR